MHAWGDTPGCCRSRGAGEGGHGGGGGGAPVYLIAPSGGVVPPGELVPLSPSDPKIGEAEKED